MDTVYDYETRGKYEEWRGRLKNFLEERNSKMKALIDLLQKSTVSNDIGFISSFESDNAKVLLSEIVSFEEEISSMVKDINQCAKKLEKPMIEYKILDFPRK